MYMHVLLSKALRYVQRTIIILSLSSSFIGVYKIVASCFLVHKTIYLHIFFFFWTFLLFSRVNGTTFLEFLFIHYLVVISPFTFCHYFSTICHRTLNFCLPHLYFAYRLFQQLLVYFDYSKFIFLTPMQYTLLCCFYLDCYERILLVFSI